MTTTKPKQDAKKKRAKRKSTSPKPDTIVTFVIGGEPRLSPGGQRVWDVDVSMKRGEWGHITSYQTTSLNDSLLEAFNTLWSKAFSVELGGLPEFPDLSKVPADDVPKAAPAGSTKDEADVEAEDSESEEEGETEDSDTLDGNAVEEEDALPLEQVEEPSHAPPQDFLDTSEDELTPEDAYAEEGDDDYYASLAEADPFAVPEAAAEFEGEYMPEDGAAYTGQELAEGDEDYGSLLEEYDLEWHDPDLTDEAADGNSTSSNNQISMF